MRNEPHRSRHDPNPRPQPRTTPTQGIDPESDDRISACNDPTGDCFVTVNGAEWHGNHRWVDAIDRRRPILRKIKGQHPFAIDAAMVVLPEPLHGIWTVPPGGAADPPHWTWIQVGFSPAIPVGERWSISRMKTGGLWLRRPGHIGFATTRISNGHR
ncbi:MAG: hypothetical protein ACFCVA_15060 [Gammaproteobacteria bacterium]